MKSFLFIGTLFVTLLFTQLCIAFELDGNWIINANGWKFIMDIDQYGQNFKGKMIPLNNSNSVTTIEGNISDNGEINFKRIESNQEYHGFIFKGVEKGRHMAGTFGKTKQLNSHQFAWFAEFQK